MSIFFKLCQTNPTTKTSNLARRALTISNNLYGNNVMFCFEQANAFTKLVNGNIVSSIPEDIIDAQQKLSGSRKLTKIPISKAIVEVHVSVGDMVEVYRSCGIYKGGMMSSPKTVLCVNNEAKKISSRHL